MTFTYCPRCGTDVQPPLASSNGITICSCGWHDNSSETRAKERLEKKTVAYMITAVVALALGYGYVAKWQNYAFSLPLLRAEQLVGVLPDTGYETLAQAYVSVNDYPAAENAYTESFEKNKSVEAMSRLGHLELRLKKDEGAFNAYKAYFKAGGKNGEAMLAFAKLLQARGNQKDALKYYELSMKAMPNVLPVQAMAGITQIMMKRGRYDEAYQRIEAFYDSAGNAKGYLNTEFAELKRLKHNKVSRSIASKRTS